MAATAPTPAEEAAYIDYEIQADRAQSTQAQKSARGQAKKRYAKGNENNRKRNLGGLIIAMRDAEARARTAKTKVTGWIDRDHIAPALALPGGMNNQIELLRALQLLQQALERLKASQTDLPKERMVAIRETDRLLAVVNDGEANLQRNIRAFRPVSPPSIPQPNSQQLSAVPPSALPLGAGWVGTWPVGDGTCGQIR